MTARPTDPRSYRLAAAVLALPPGAPLPPPGVAADRWRRALRADVVEVVDDLAGVALVHVHRRDADTARPLAALDALARWGATIGALLAGDAPDLPGLLVGKLFSGCEDRPVAVCPAEGGGLVGIAARLPPPGWLRAAGLSLDDPDALAALHAAAPAGHVLVGPGWHRLREPADVHRLDPGLEGWEETRALLT